MSILDSILLGIIQGLTEFLPVSSSGHLEIGKVLLGIEVKESLAFTVAVHGATALSTIVVFREDIIRIVKQFCLFQMNPETVFVFKIIVSMIPVFIVGVFFKDQVEALFDGNLLLVGSMMLVTALMLSLTHLGKREKSTPIDYVDALVIGMAQALAVLPGLSRSGATIATGLILGKNKAEVARFAFLMAIAPIVGGNLLDVVGGGFDSNNPSGVGPLLAGFTAAFVVGYLSCRWMIALVQKGKLILFAAYCLVVGLIAILATTHSI